MAEPVWRAITDSPRLTRRRLVGLVAASAAAGLVAGCDGERLSYALSIGITNGDLFREIIAFSPGFMAPDGEVDRPRIYISHGVHDQVLPIDHCSRRIVPQLRRAGYDVTYHEFDGPHTVPPEIAREALTWFLGE
jgi:phospholipase/carboxylesterase